MGVNIRVSHGRLFLDIYWKGMRKWENLNLRIPEDKQGKKDAMRLAEIVRMKREQQLMAGEYNLQDIVAGKQPLVAYAEKIAGTQSDKNPLPKSLKYLREYAGTITIGGLDHSWIESYRQYLLDQPTLSQSTASRYLASLKNLLRQALRDRLIIRDPTTYTKGIAIPDAETYHLTLEEIGRLAATPLGGGLGAEVKTAFLFGCYSGLRISDLRTLTWGQILRDPLAIQKQQQKTKAIVNIPLHASAWAIIKDDKIHSASEYVFPMLASTKTNTNQYLVAWAGHAGIQKQLGWHVARRTFGTLALQAGGDLKTVSELLGHKKITHTARYLKSNSATQRHAVEAIPSLEIKQAEVLPLRVRES